MFHDRQVCQVRIQSQANFNVKFLQTVNGHQTPFINIKLYKFVKKIKVNICEMLTKFFMDLSENAANFYKKLGQTAD